jgi:transposase
MTLSYYVDLDLAKTVFQVHGIDHPGKQQLSKRIQRHAVLNFFANLPSCVSRCRSLRDGASLGP